MKYFKLGKSTALTLIMLLLAPSMLPAMAQAQQSDGAQSAEVVIPDGTEFSVETTDEISSKTATEGDLLTFKVGEDVKIKDQIVIAKGTLVKGSVSNAKKAV